VTEMVPPVLATVWSQTRPSGGPLLLTVGLLTYRPNVALISPGVTTLQLRGFALAKAWASGTKPIRPTRARATATCRPRRRVSPFRAQPGRRRERTLESFCRCP
jgi:hypothetical protein